MASCCIVVSFELRRICFWSTLFNSVLHFVTRPYGTVLLLSMFTTTPSSPAVEYEQRQNSLALLSVRSMLPG